MLNVSALSEGDIVFLKGSPVEDKRSYYIVLSTFQTYDIWKTKVYDGVEALSLLNFEKRSFCQIDLDVINKNPL